MAITFSNIGLAEPSTITNRMAAVTVARGSTNEEQEILVVGDPESSLGLARVTDTTPASTAFGLVVREAVPQSTGPFVISSVVGPVNVRSSAANALFTAYQSSAADLNVTVAGYVAPSTTITIRQSTAGDLNVLAKTLPAAAFTYGQVTLGSTAVEISAASTARHRLVVVQCSTIDVYLGASTVTSTSGILLAGVRGNQYIFRHTAAVSGISTGGSPVVSFSQETF